MPEHFFPLTTLFPGNMKRAVKQTFMLGNEMILSESVISRKHLLERIKQLPEKIKCLNIKTSKYFLTVSFWNGKFCLWP